MASHQILNQRKAQAMAEAVQTTERLLGGESERLHSAQRDVTGRQMQDYVFSMLIAELTRVVADQQERIDRMGSLSPGPIDTTGVLRNTLQVEVWAGVQTQASIA